MFVNHPKWERNTVCIPARANEHVIIEAWPMAVHGLSIALLVATLWQAQARSTSAPPEQPLPFSHKKHSLLDLECLACHPIPEPGLFATLPDTASCMLCHTTVSTDSPHIQQLAQFHSRNEEVPWKRVYRIPDYVFFSHKEHVTGAGVTCEICHGPVREMEQMQKAKPLSMAACMDCHRQEGASLDCDFCHDPL